MYINSTDVNEIVSAIVALPKSEQDVVAIFVGEKDHPDLSQLVAQLNAQDLVFFGGLFPGILAGTHQYESGVVALVLPCLAAPFVVANLNADAIDIPQIDDDFLLGQSTAMILVDGLASHIAEFLGEMYHYFGDAVHYVGGGAGSLSLKQTPCVFTPNGVFQDAAVVTFLDLESQLGVQHGWERLMGPFVATKTQNNVILELNWECAFDVYRRVVEPDANVDLSAENFFSVAKGYPFGIFKEGLEDVVRDPISVTPDGALVCVGNVPENTTLNILKGDAPHLISAAGRATKASLENQTDLKTCFVVDCISRVIFLEEDFTKELETIAQQVGQVQDGMIPYGILSLGEISSYGDGLLEFFNKTVVVGMLS